MEHRGDFTAQGRLVIISAFAVAVGGICSVVAVVLLWLIAFFTNLFFFQTISFTFHPPAENTLGLLVIFVPVVGGLIIGLMARYGSDRIRGHGIPEALEAILFFRSRMSPKVAVLKPLSSAISIGSGGPFGAEGPIIMTGGAVGSIIAQLFKLTSAERKTLLVAGAAGGMTATFGTPVAAVLLAVELLLFEWKPRSLIPVAVASSVAASIRPFLMGNAPLFPIMPHAQPLDLLILFSAVFVGLLGGVLAMILTRAVYAAEETFEKLPIHWMWWPAIGGLIVGVGGYFEPRVLGVGYDLIEQLLKGEYVPGNVLAIMLVKGTIWALALGSGTSGGVLGPLLILGGSVGALVGTFLPGHDAALWPLITMAAVLGGAMRSPLTGAVFALELTYDIRVLPALLIASIVSHGFTVLLMKRSILTEKVARRGYHISREYAVDPLELVSVGDVMTTDVVSVPARLPIKDLLHDYFLAGGGKKHQGYPVLDEDGRLIGIVTEAHLLEDWVAALLNRSPQSPVPDQRLIIAYDLIHDGHPVTVYPWESCRTAAERLAEARVELLPVVSPEKPDQVIGVVTPSNLLKPRASQVVEEGKREQFIRLNWFSRFWENPRSHSA
jgi:H+/Cl- antiporter ClcA